MQDYPTYDDGRMTQVFNGGKMLFDGPADIGTPSVLVNGLVFYVNELLQLVSGRYFIPEKFFFAKSPESGGAEEGGSEKELYALGYNVQRIDVSLDFLIYKLSSDETNLKGKLCGGSREGFGACFNILEGLRRHLFGSE